MTDKQAIFDLIFKQNVWGSAESKSGLGSNLNNTKSIRNFLPEFIKYYGIKSMIDAPCGDVYWFSKMDLKKIEYYGYDIVDDLIKINKEKFSGNKNYHFEKKDVIIDSLPKVDLILCRDLIIHFPINAVYDLINNFIKSKSKYLLITQHIIKNNAYEINKDIDFGYFSFRSLIEPPFNFPNPKLLVPEDWDDKNIMRFLALYELKDLDDFLKNSR